MKDYERLYDRLSREKRPLAKPRERVGAPDQARHREKKVGDATALEEAEI
jgi:hypothetical protein